MTDLDVDGLLFRLPKQSLGVRGCEPVRDALKALCERAGDSGCGGVNRDELVSALIVAAAASSDDQLKSWVDGFRASRVSDISAAGREKQDE
jgi:hypothetical protein